LSVLLPGVAAFAMLYVAAGAVGPTPVDAAALQESLVLRTAGLTAFAVVLTNIGSTVSMAVLAVLVGGWLLVQRRVADAVLVVGAMAGSAALFSGLKNLIDRQRPPEATRLVTETNESLPSGHAAMSIVVIGTLVLLAWPSCSTLARAAMVAGAALWVGAVGATRIYLGVHWFTDVVAGWLVGATWLAVCVAAWSWWVQRRVSHRVE